MNNIFSEYETCWVFHGDTSRFANAVFAKRQDAESWIAKHRLSGLLTEYPINHGMFDIAASLNLIPKNIAAAASPQYIQQYVLGISHGHYENGLPV